MHRNLKIAYLSLQAVVDGQDTWAAVTEIIGGFESEGWVVDRYFPDYPPGEAPGGLARLSEMARVQRRLIARLTEYDAVYIRSHPLARTVARAARDAGIPVVQECNGPYEDLFIAWPVTRLGRPWFEHVQRSQYRDASVVISVADGLTEWLKAEARHDRVITNGNGANVDAFTPDAMPRAGLPSRFAVFFGQFPAWQGIGTLLEAVRRPDWPSDLALVFVGDGAMRPAVEEAVRDMPERVHFLGRLPYLEVAQVVAAAVVSYVPMVMPEREAKFSPLKLYESMACGVPVIASDTIGISEVVNAERCGILVPPGDAAAVVEATKRVLSDPEGAAAMGRRGREAAVERYSWRARARQRAEIIESAVEQGSR